MPHPGRIKIRVLKRKSVLTIPYRLVSPSHVTVTTYTGPQALLFIPVSLTVTTLYSRLSSL